MILNQYYLQIMKYLLSLFSLILAIPSIGQDSLVKYSEIHFNSEFEKEVFHNYFKEGRDNYLALFMAVYPGIDQKQFTEYEQVYESNLNSLPLNKLGKKSPEKRVKVIYNEIHDSFLKKYEAQNHFSEIFAEGSYNCVSASALYGIVFSRLGIPFVIKEKPTHVYLMAYPDTESLLVESTDPSGGFLDLNDRAKTAFVAQMKKAKLISEQEFQLKTTEQLFDEYYFSDQNIDLKELVGIQYTNDALYHLEKGAYEKAYHQLEKSYLFYPAEKIVSLMVAVNVEHLQNSLYDDMKYIDYLSRLSRFEDYGITPEMIISQFNRIIDLHLINKGNEKICEAYFDRFTSHVKDDKMREAVEYFYNYERGRILYNQGRYAESLQFIEKAYKLKPENLEVSSMFVGALGQSLRFDLSNLTAIENLEKYQEQFPALLKNNRFRSLLVNAYLIQAGLSFDLGHITTANDNKSKFEMLYNRELNIDPRNIGRVYSLAAIYYFKKGHTKRAKGLLAKGLEYAPGNHELLVRQRMVGN